MIQAEKKEFTYKRNVIVGAKCDKCGKDLKNDCFLEINEKIRYVDENDNNCISSMDEYNSIDICEDCAKTIFNNLENERHNDMIEALEDYNY